MSEFVRWIALITSIYITVDWTRMKLQHYEKPTHTKLPQSGSKGDK